MPEADKNVCQRVCSKRFWSLSQGLKWFIYPFPIPNYYSFGSYGFCVNASCVDLIPVYSHLKVGKEKTWSPVAAISKSEDKFGLQRSENHLAKLK